MKFVRSLGSRGAFARLLILDFLLLLDVQALFCVCSYSTFFLQESAHVGLSDLPIENISLPL